MLNATASADDFVEVFVEEAGEVFEIIDNRLPVWRKRPTDTNALTEIRRGFHTLKGSGRMVNGVRQPIERKLTLRRNRLSTKA